MNAGAAWGSGAGGGLRRRTRLGASLRVLASVAQPLLEVIFPPRCVGCGDFEWHVCPSCQASLRAVGEDSCPRCGSPGPRVTFAGRCRECMGEELSFAGARAAFLHQGTADRLVAAFKFGGQVVLGRVMAELASPAFAAFLGSLPEADRMVATWVPSHPHSQRARGYNQAEVLAKALTAGRASMTATSLLRKTKRTRQQKELDRVARRENLRGAFVMDEGWSKRIPPWTKALLLIDDVFTTGATVQEVSAVLSGATGLPVYVFTFSRALGGGKDRHD